jgi:AbrB family looped-hinge helix DNA binding protein
MSSEGLIMPTATMTSKGQITVPAQIRAALRLDAGDKIDFIEIEKGQFAIRARTASIRDLEGCIPKLDHVPTIEEINEAIADAAAENYMPTDSQGVAANQHGEAA